MFQIEREVSASDFRFIVYQKDLSHLEARSNAEYLIESPDFPIQVIVNTRNMETGEIVDFWIKDTDGKVYCLPPVVYPE